MADSDQPFTGASGTAYRMNFGTNAACRVEAALDRSYDEIMAELRGEHPRVSTVRAWVKAALVEPIGDSLTPEQVGDAIDDLGGWLFILVAMDSRSAEAIKVAAELQSALAALHDVTKPTTEVAH